MMFQKTRHTAFVMKTLKEQLFEYPELLDLALQLQHQTSMHMQLFFWRRIADVREHIYLVVISRGAVYYSCH